MECPECESVEVEEVEEGLFQCQDCGCEFEEEQLH